MKPYPLFLIDLHERRCVVIGADGEAVRKVRGLLECGARVTVIAPALPDELDDSLASGEIDWVERGYEPGDLRQAFLVFASVRDPAMVRRIRAEGEAERALVNVIDDVRHSNAIAGSVLRRGGLVLAISTSGIAPALAVRMRERFEREIGPEYGLLLDLLQHVRPGLARRYAEFQQRRSIWYEIVDSAALEHVRAGRVDQARSEIERIIDRRSRAPARG